MSTRAFLFKIKKEFSHNDVRDTMLQHIEQHVIVQSDFYLHEAFLSSVPVTLNDNIYELMI